MKIGIELNEVLRNYIGQLAYTYEKYIGDLDITEDDVTNFNLIEFFKFENIDKLNSFIYLEAPLEIFGHAGQMSDGLMNHFNAFIKQTIAVIHLLTFRFKKFTVSMHYSEKISESIL